MAWNLCHQQDHSWSLTRRGCKTCNPMELAANRWLFSVRFQIDFNFIHMTEKLPHSLYPWRWINPHWTNHTSLQIIEKRLQKEKMSIPSIPPTFPFNAYPGCIFCGPGPKNFRAQRFDDSLKRLHQVAVTLPKQNQDRLIQIHGPHLQLQDTGRNILSL